MQYAIAKRKYHVFVQKTAKLYIKKCEAPKAIRVKKRCESKGGNQGMAMMVG